MEISIARTAAAKEEDVTVNLWDDFVDGGDTFIYVEEHDMLDEDKEAVLQSLISVMDNSKLLEDSPETEADIQLGHKPRINLTNITHGTLGKLRTDLKSLRLTYQNTPLDIISES
jgi:hypothetical protein